MISFDNLWNIMREKNVSQYKLIHEYGISPSQLTRLKRNESVTTNTIDTFCKILDCDISDIMTFTKE
ncbi:MAG: helix-turn-helix transcriptional regulator [Lachnospiraceae bacterium]|nr:helix-turn-helix transcriptional regulator [Lachnospiraceae bacterium]